MEKKFDSIIIGAGIGGLIAGARLSQKGKRVLVLEQHYIPGGSATTFKRKDFLMEVGLHEMDGLDKFDAKTKIYKELGILKNLEFIKIPEFYRVLNNGKKMTDFIFPDDAKKAKKTLITQFPKEKRGINKYFKFILSLRREIFYFTKLSSWQVGMIFLIFPILFPYLTLLSGRMLGILAHTNPLFWLLRPNFLFWIATRNSYNIKSFLDKIIKNEELKLILTSNYFYYHDDLSTTSLLYFGIAQGNYIEGGSWYIKGGSQKLSNYLSDYITSHGGTVMLGKKATEIITEKNKAIGVKYRNTYQEDQEHEAYSANVIANSAIPNLLDYLSGKNKEKLFNKIKDMELSCSLISIYIGFKKNLKKEFGSKAYSTFILPNIDSYMDYVKYNIHGETKDRGFAFVDYSCIDAGLTSEDKTVGTLCTVDYLRHWEGLTEEEYEKKKEDIFKSFIAKLESVMPGVTDEIEHYEVGTPQTIKKFTLNPSAATYGFAQIPNQSGQKRIQYKSPIKNLYFSSAWTMPGGGFTGASLAGAGCARVILSKYKKNINKIRTSLIEDTQTSRLLENNKIAEDTIELIFEKPKDFEHYIPGQYVVLSIDKPVSNYLDMPLRLLSIASHPDEKELRFAMKKSSSAFKKSCIKMQIGETAKIYGPMGNLTLDHKKNPIVFIISGIGITPVISMLKELIKKDYNQAVYLFYSNKTKEKTAWHNYFLSVKFTNFKYIPVFTKTQKRIDIELLSQHLKTLKDKDYYIIGTGIFVKSMQTILLQANIKKEHIKIDDFG